MELLNSRELEEQNKLFVQKSLTSINKLQGLIYDLLDVSKIQAGQLQLDIKEFNLSTLISECIHEAQMSTSLHSIINEDELANPIIYADRKQNRTGYH